MKLAVLADIHGNSFALTAVLHDMARCGVTQAVNLGDHLSGPIDAAGTADLLMAQDFVAIRGNHDRWLVEQDPAQMGPSDKVAFDVLQPAQLDWLKSLPPTATHGDDVFLCHGTPSSDASYWLERVEPNGVIRPASRDEVEREADNIDAGRSLCGHTHLPRLAQLERGAIILNPGSVGCPAYDDDTPVYHRMQTGSPNASYAIVEGVGRDRVITFRSIPYDAQAAAQCAARNGRDDWARGLATGWHEPR